MTYTSGDYVCGLPDLTEKNTFMIEIPIQANTYILDKVVCKLYNTFIFYFLHWEGCDDLLTNAQIPWKLNINLFYM